MKQYVVTGGTSGIGLAVAQLLSQDPACRVFCVADAIGAFEGAGLAPERVQFVHCDVTQPQACSHAAALVSAQGGAIANPAAASSPSPAAPGCHASPRPSGRSPGRGRSDRVPIEREGELVTAAHLSVDGGRAGCDEVIEYIRTCLTCIRSLTPTGRCPAHGDVDWADRLC